MANDMSPDRPPDRFELTTYLEGRTRAWGIFEDRFGHLRRRFSVEMTGHWHDRVFLLDEHFHYDSGETERRTWRIVPGEDGRFTATCEDCLGEATGAAGRDSVRMSYKLRLKMGARELIVDFDDRIYRMGDTIAMNRATMSKWGVRLGEVSLFFEREGLAHETPAAEAAAAR